MSLNGKLEGGRLTLLPASVALIYWRSGRPRVMPLQDSLGGRRKAKQVCFRVLGKCEHGNDGLVVRRCVLGGTWCDTPGVGRTPFGLGVDVGIGFH